MRAYVRFRLPDGSTVELGHGDLIGRLWSAALSLPDGRVSEAHAMVSLRGQELKLLALRGRFALQGQPRSSLVLRPGQRIAFAEGLELVVEDIELPTTVLAIEGDELPRQVLNGVCSLRTRPRPELVPRFVDASAHIWSDGEGWLLGIEDQVRALEPGDAWELDGLRFRAVAADLEAAGRSATRLEGGVHRQIHLVANFDTVHLHDDQGRALALSGLSARILSELVAFDGPVPWRVLAAELWPREDDPHLQRKKLDVSLARLRRKLRQAEVRVNLVRADGFGHYELFLLPGDTVENRT